MKREELDDYYYYEDTVMTPANHLHRVYHADEVDHLLDEKDAEIESLKASHYAEMVDAGMRERRLRRALFIAHAIKAKFKWWWMSECKHNESCKLFPDTRKIKKFTNSAWVCSKSQEKCRAKAEEYK